MAKLPKSAVVLKLDPYKHHVVLVTKRKDFHKLCKHHDEPGDEVGLVQVCNRNGLVFHMGVFDDEVSTLAHEAAHVVLSLFDYIGMPVDAKSSEAFCYLLEHIVSNFAPVIKEAGKC